MRAFARVAAVAFFLSGAAGLIHEVVWIRLLGHVFGVTAFAVSTVLASYMGGLALGAFLIGRRCQRIGNPARVYALLEIGIGAFALAFPLLLDGLEPVYGILWRRLHLSFVVFSGIRFVLAGSLLLVPTAMMGATLPLLADHFAARAGRRLAPEWLYTINLAGATAGVAAGGFVLLPLLGVRGTIVAGAVLNVAAGLLVLARLPGTAPAASTPSAAAAARRGGRAPAPEVEPAAMRRAAPIFVSAAFISGFASLAAQVAWTRVLSLMVGSTIWALTTVLLAFLLTMAGASVWASRRAARGTEPRAALAVVAALGAPALLAAMAAVNHWPSWYWAAFSAWRPGGMAGAIAINVIAVCGILSLPLLLAGTIFPLSLAASTPRASSSTGRAVGMLYAVNTIGAILGATLGGFLLVPAFGSRGTLAAICLATAIFGVGCALTSGRRPLTAAASVSLLAVVVGLWMLPAWDQKTLNAAIYEPRPGVDPRDKNREDVVVYHREGPTATVMVLDRQKDRYLRINGRVNASNHPPDMATNVLLSQLPLLLSPRPHDVLVVGLGSGVTAGAALQSSARRVTVVELEPAVVEASHLFDDVNGRPLEDPRLRLYEDDARHLLVASDDLYDVIISEPSHPWVSGVCNLFTQDFFALAANRLRPDGLFSQWLQTYQIAGETFRSILASFQSVFPEVLIFRSSGTDLILLGSKRPLGMDVASLEERLSSDRVLREMSRINIRRWEDLMAHFMTGPQDVRRLAAGAPINTDDNMLVEFRAPADLLRVGSQEIEAILSGLPFTPIEDVLSDPARLTGRRGSLHALVRALRDRDRPAAADRYERLLGR